MKTFVPNYYKDFKCIAEKCKHNCCIGWEIDIDDDTLKKYENAKGNFRKILDQGINNDSECACFMLDGKGRCAFLNENNLCDIILYLGEGALCQICADHPRFRNHIGGHLETGLGICCEEACRIILSQKEKFSLELLSEDNFDSLYSDDTPDFYSFRNSLFELLENVSISIEEKRQKLISLIIYDFPDKTVCEWAEIFLSLERLDDYWTNLLEELKETDIENIVIPDEFNLYFLNLMKYFIFRYLTDRNQDLGIILAVVSEYFISCLCKMHIKKYGEIRFEDIVEYARMYSSEIEYSDENIDEITYYL